MKPILNESEPIFQQIANIIIDDIIEGQLNENDRIPSENELSSFYGINRATVRNGLQILLDMDLIYKKRGIGMFVKVNAKKKLLVEKQNKYLDSFIRPMIREGKRLGLNIEAIINLIHKEDKT